MGEQFDGAGGGGADIVTSAVGFPILICVSSASKVDTLRWKAVGTSLVVLKDQGCSVGPVEVEE